MTAIIDLDSELLVDQSRVSNPYLRLLLAVVGQKLAKGSPWLAVNKTIADEYALRVRLIEKQRNDPAA